MLKDKRHSFSQKRNRHMRQDFCMPLSSYTSAETHEYRSASFFFMQACRAILAPFLNSFFGHGSSGLTQCTVTILPHVTPSPRVPAATILRNYLTRVLYNLPHTRAGFTERTVTILPHVTPFPRVPAATMLRRPVSHLSSWPHREARVYGAHGYDSASRHSFPKSTCSHHAA